MTTLRIITADVFDGLSQLEDESVQCVVTSPPYWSLRDYGIEGQIGLERTPDEYVEKMTRVFREVRRVLRDDAVLWLNMGDSYAAGTNDYNSFRRDRGHVHVPRNAVPQGLKPKDLCGMPWRVAFALQTDGWYLRSDIIWHKPNPMPESVIDRPTKAHEYVFLMTKNARYFYDADAIKEPVTGNAHVRGDGVNPKAKVPAGWDTGPGSHRKKAGRYPRSKQNESFSGAVNELVNTCNARTVWTIPTQAYPECHFATFPTALPERCIKAGSRRGDTVLDPFGGSGTTAVVARGLGRDAIIIEINPEYVRLIEKRCALPWERTTTETEGNLALDFGGDA